MEQAPQNVSNRKNFNRNSMTSQSRLHQMQMKCASYRYWNSFMVHETSSSKFVLPSDLFSQTKPDFFDWNINPGRF